jgi:Pyruvate/2-oxoacid:ferredoxin oxidoreductase delta subunit
MHLWLKREAWQRIAVDGEITLPPSPEPDELDSQPVVAAVVPYLENGTPRAALITTSGAELSLNGFPPLGVAVLQDRDEITLAGETFLFAAHSPTEPVSFHSDTLTRCARCKRPLRAGDMAVRCAACSSWHHEGALAGTPGAERRCFSYDPVCAGCGRQRESMLWTPEESDDD